MEGLTEIENLEVELMHAGVQYALGNMTWGNAIERIRENVNKLVVLKSSNSSWQSDEGGVSRDQHGHPISVRQIVNIIPIVEDGDYTQARGILPLAKGDELPEVQIRRTRDE